MWLIDRLCYRLAFVMDGIGESLNG